MKNKLSASVLMYWLFKALILPVILGAILFFLSTQNHIQATVNGQPTIIDGSVFSPLIVFGIPAALFILAALYWILYYNMFSFVVTEGSISITSGVLFSSTKTTDFRAVQDVATKRGPLLMIFGLGILQGFTSSPDQIRVSGGSFRLGGGAFGNNARTTYNPDISIPLPAVDAEQLRSQIATSAEVQKVQVVSPGTMNTGGM
jgi:membrane protein YdbS with pleckstrin-like domain